MPQAPLPSNNVNAFVLRRVLVGEDVEFHEAGRFPSVEDAYAALPADSELGVYGRKGRPGKDGFPPRFELIDRQRTPAQRPRKPVQGKSVDSFA